MATLLDHDDIELLLRELAGQLHADGVTAGIRVVGGAAIALMNADRRRRRRSPVPRRPVRAMAATMAIERDLPADWLNDAAKDYVGLDDWHAIFRVVDVTVSVGSVAMLHAMKLRANRRRRDIDDIEYILARCEVTSVKTHKTSASATTPRTSSPIWPSHACRRGSTRTEPRAIGHQEDQPFVPPFFVGRVGLEPTT